MISIRIIILLAFSIFPIGCDTIVSDKPIVIDGPPTGEPITGITGIKSCVDANLKHVGDTAGFCNNTKLSSGKVCVYENEQCIEATKCDQLDRSNCNDKSIENKLCSYDSGSTSCTERFDCEKITDLSQCDGKPTMDTLGAKCHVIPVSGQRKCVIFPNSPKDKLWAISAGPGALVVRASYHSIENRDYFFTFGANTDNRLNIPADVTKVHTIATNYACGTTIDDTGKCWGSNTGNRATPPMEKFKKIVAKDAYACGLIKGGAHDKRIACWGVLPLIATNISELVEITKTVPGRATHVATEFSSFALTDNQLCATLDHSIQPYTFSGESRRGYIFCSKDWVPKSNSFAFEYGFKDIWAGNDYFCASDRDNKAVCYQDNYNNVANNMNVGVFFKNNVNKPGLSVADYDWLRNGFALSNDFACFQHTAAPNTNRLDCFNKAGLSFDGDATTGVNAIPPSLNEAKAFAAGSNFACAIQESSGKIFCWGSDGAAMLATIPAIFK